MFCCTREYCIYQTGISVSSLETKTLAAGMYPLGMFSHSFIGLYKCHVNTRRKKKTDLCMVYFSP